MRYSIEPRDRIYVKDTDICHLLKTWVHMQIKSLKV